jgi:hypothetical protein
MVFISEGAVGEAARFFGGMRIPELSSVAG